MKPTYIPVIELSALLDNDCISDEQYDFICENDNYGHGDNDKTLISVQRIINDLESEGSEVDGKLKKLVNDKGAEVFVDLEN